MRGHACSDQDIYNRLTHVAGYIKQADILSDGIHPTNDGYRKMAAVWNVAIEKARKSGFLQEPEDTGIPDDGDGRRLCQKIPGQADGPHQTQKGYGVDDGPYRHKSTQMQFMPTALRRIGRDGSKGIAFAQIVNQGGNPDPKGGLDDLIYYQRLYSGNGNFYIKMEYWENNGDGTFGGPQERMLPFDCPSEDIRWADMDGDGYDDYICVFQSGDIRIGTNSQADPAEFKEWGEVHLPAHDGYEGRHVRLGDIDGDGRTDYCLIGDDGNTRCWRNGGYGQTPEYWEDIGLTFPPKGKGDIRGTRFVDLTGDGRADWVVSTMVFFERIQSPDCFLVGQRHWRHRYLHEYARSECR